MTQKLLAHRQFWPLSSYRSLYVLLTRRLVKPQQLKGDPTQLDRISSVLLMFLGLAKGAICSGDKAGLRVVSLHDGPAITIFLDADHPFCETLTRLGTFPAVCWRANRWNFYGQSLA